MVVEEVQQHRGRSVRRLVLILEEQETESEYKP